MDANLNCPRVHAIRRAPTGPWIELMIIEPGHKYDKKRIPVCTGTVRLDLDGPHELARFMGSLNKAFERFLRDEFGASPLAGDRTAVEEKKA